MSNQILIGDNHKESSIDSALQGSKGHNKSPANQDNDYITILHFNDCYNVEPGPQSSGAAGFLTAIKQHKTSDPMILFSGDILSPSFMSTFTKGEQMIPVLNDIGVSCAVFGNHEFDYGVDNLIDFVKKTTFPWLLSNVIDKETSNQLGDGQVFHVLERSGYRFGLIGLIEEEWLSTLSTLDSSDVIYQDFVERGQELARLLKSEPHNVDYVIALTHFRTPNDIRLADSVPEIDLILGGHDHDYEVIKRPNSYIIKSGTDFREFSKVKLKINHDYVNNRRSSQTDTDFPKPFSAIDIERIKCLNYEPDKELKSKLDKFVSTIDEKMGKVLGQFNCDLDGRFSSIRKFETNLGNFVTDIMLASTHADMAILNSGTLRSDRIHPRGNFTMRDLFNILGYIDPIAVLEASGEQIWRALENGVSQWPKLEGRFPQVGGCSFVFDPKQPPMKRIIPENILIGDEPLVLTKLYRLTTKAYLASGKDGYDMLKDCKVLVPGDESPDLTTSILNHFEAINIVKSNRRTHHRQSIICLSRMSLQKILDHQAQCEQQEQNISNTSTKSSLSPILPCSACSPSTNSSTNQQIRRGDSSDVHNGSQTQVCNNSTFLINSLRGGSSGGSTGGSSSAIGQSDEDQNDNDNDNENRNETFDVVEDNSDTFGDTPVTAYNCMIRRHSTKLSPLPNTSSPLVGFAATDSVCQSPNAPLTIIQAKPRTKRLMSLYEMEHEQCKLEPKVEGRIRIIGVNV